MHTFHKLMYLQAGLLLLAFQSLATPTLDTLTICNGQSITIQGTTISSAGQYSITFQPGDSIVHYTVYVSQPFVSLGDDITVCERIVGMLIPQGSPGYYTWNNGMVADSVFIGVSGLYSVTVTDIYGCTASDAITVTIQPNPNPIIENIPDPVCFGSNDIVLNGLPAGGTFSGDLLIGNTFQASQAAIGFYNVYYAYTDSVGCSSTINAYIQVALCTGVESLSSQQKVFIEHYTLYVLGSGAYQITDIMGRTVLQGFFNGTPVSLENLAPGMYILQSTLSGANLKFILE